MQGKFTNKGNKRKKFDDSKKECFNCHKKGHMVKDCWAKGGGKEGQGPRSRQKGKNANWTNQATDARNTLPNIAYMARTRTISPDDWVLDSATTSHICNNRNAFTGYTKLGNTTVQGLGEVPAQAKGQGSVTIEFTMEGKIIQHKLKDVIHIPEAPNSLLSISRFDESEGYVGFQNGTCRLYVKGDTLVGTGQKINRLYRLDARSRIRPPERANIATTKKSWDVWHQLYGHIGTTGLETLHKKGLVTGLDVDETSKPSRFCEACVQVKQTIRPFPKEADGQSKVPGERTISDVWGPARVESIGGAKYYISFTDDAACVHTPLFTKNKGQATRLIQHYILEIEKKFGQNPKYLRFDNGSKLVNKEMKKWAGDKGIVIETTTPYSPQQHGTAERLNRTLLELAHTMLIAKGLPTFLWAEAVLHTSYIRNHSPTKALDGLTPIEAWTGKKPDVSHFREFECDVWILNQGVKGSKLAPKSTKMVYVGFSDAQKAIWYYDKTKRSVHTSRNFIFNKDELLGEVRLESDLPGIQLVEEDNLVEPEQMEIETSPTGKSSVPEKEGTHEEITYLPRRSTCTVDRDY